jgi:hypothetical protein
MENYITHLLLGSMKKEQEYHSARWKMGDQQMGVTKLSSLPMGAHNMLTHWRQRMMCQDGNTIQDR